MNQRKINPLQKAAAIIKKGGLVIFPTETVYGVGANVFSEQAVQKIFKVKGRPGDNPLIVHIADRRDVGKVALGMSTLAKKLIDRFWPGPLTIVLKKQPAIPEVVTAGLETVAVRLPNHALARAFIRKAGVPVAAPSANPSGRLSPTEPNHLKKGLAEKVDFVLTDKRSRYGLESTVVDVLRKPPVILRQGAITKEELEKVVGEIKIAGDSSPNRSPGMKQKHYAPKTRLILSDKIPVLVADYQKKGKKVGVLGSRENYYLYKKADRVILLGSQKNLSLCGRNLFKALHDFDRRGDVDVIIAEIFPEKGLGAAIMDRLRRAAAKA